MDKNSSFFLKYRIFTISIIGLASLFVVNRITGLSIDYASVLFGGAYIMLGLGAWRVWQDHSNGTHSKAWASFVIFAAAYSIGEIFWSMCAKDIANSCLVAETIWNVGYLPLIGFAILYIKPFFDSISKKNIIISVLISISILVPALYYIVQYDDIADDPELWSVYLYTIFDAILLVPMIIGFFIFFGGRANFAWSMMMFAILSMTIADFMFITAKINGSQFFDEWQNIFYVGEYAFFSLGLYYKSKNVADGKERFYNQESLK